MALTYAYVFMVTLEEEAIYLSQFFKFVTAWWRFMGDIFVIWTGTQEDLVEFFGFFNGVDRDIKFTMLISEYVELTNMLRGDIFTHPSNGAQFCVN